MSHPLHPSEGIRMLLERVSVGEGALRSNYAASVYTTDQLYRFDVELALDGSATIRAAEKEIPDTGAPEEHSKTLLKLCKSIARAAKRKLEEDLPPWPPRILRWRGPGRG